jgi:hypothetical protein
MEEEAKYIVLPRTVEAACNRLINELSEKDLKSAMDHDVTDLHFTLGLYIRNQFRPYMDENEELIRDCLKCAGVNVVGDNVITKSILAQYQGDEASSIIIRVLKEKLNEK